MRFWLLVFGCLITASCHADEIGGRVLLPDGKPAENAKVIARIIHSGRTSAGSWNLRQEEIITETDLLGFFDATVPKIPLTAGNRSMRPYLLVDAPGCALYFTILTDVVKIGGKSRAIIQLKPNFSFTGTVLGPGRKPVSNARVKVAYWSWGGFESSTLNYLKYVETPQLITYTNAQGKFALRGISVPGENEVWGSFGGVSAVGTINGSAWANRSSLSDRDHKEASPSKKPLEIVLTPTVTFSGRVLNALNGKPLSGVQVSTTRYAPDLESSGRTDASGAFQVVALSPAQAQLRLRQTLTGPLAWQNDPDPWQRTLTSLASQKQTLSGPRWIKNLEFRLAPLTSIRGQLIDAASGQKPLRNDDVTATFETTMQNGWQVTPQPGFTYSRDAEFFFAVPAGKVTLASGTRPQYPHAYAAAPQSFSIKPNSVQDIRLVVKRNPGYFLLLQPRDKNETLLSGPYHVQWRRQNGAQGTEEMRYTAGGYDWFKPATRWGETLEARIVYGSSEIMPWRTVKATPDKWPLRVMPAP